MVDNENRVVELFGLESQPDLNGRRARTLKWNEEKQRMECSLLDDDTRIAVKAENLRFVEGIAAAAPSSGATQTPGPPVDLEATAEAVA